MDTQSPLKMIFSSRVKIYTPKEIKFIRKKLNETQEVFANRFFSSRSCVRKWESGTREMAGASLRLMQFCEAEALDKENDFNTAVRFNR